MSYQFHNDCAVSFGCFGSTKCCPTFELTTPSHYLETQVVVLSATTCRSPYAVRFTVALAHNGLPAFRFDCLFHWN